MSEVRSEDAEGTLRSGTCKSVDKLQTNSECKESAATRNGEHVEQSSALENESEDISAHGKRGSGCSYETENSILSPHLSLQALQALNDATAQDDDKIQGAEEICLCVQEPLNEILVEGNPVAFREFDSICSSPLLNGYAADDVGVHIRTESPQETLSEGNSQLTNRGSRILSFLRSKLRTPSSNSKRSNGDIIVTVNAEEVTTHDPRLKPKPSINDRVKSWLQPMDNKMNVKVFGSRKAMADEVIRFKKAGWIIHPTSAFRFGKPVIVSYKYSSLLLFYWMLFLLFFPLRLFFIYVSIRFLFIRIVGGLYYKTQEVLFQICLRVIPRALN